MRHTIFIGGTRYVTDGIDAYTHCVVAQLNKAPLTPPSRSLSPKQIQDLGPEAREKTMEELRQFALEETAGRFALKPARWATSAEEAGTMASALIAEREGDSPKYAVVSAIPVAGVLPHA